MRLLLNRVRLERRLLAGGAWVFAGRGIAVLATVVTNGLLARLLTAQEMGAYFLASSVVLFGMVIASLGLRETVVRLVAENMSLGQWRRVRHVVGLVFRIASLAALGTGFLYLLVGDMIGAKLFHSPELGASSRWIGIWIVVASLQAILAETFRGFNRIGLATLFGGLLAGLLLVGGITVLWWTQEPTTLVLVIGLAIMAGAVSTLLGGGVLLRKVASLPPQPALELREPKMRYKSLLAIAAPLLITSVTLCLLTQVDLWILGLFRSAEEVAVYGAASRLAQLVGTPLLIANAVVPPVIAELYAQGKKKELESTLRRVAGLTILPAILASTVFLFFPGALLELIYGHFYRPGAIALVLLCIGQAVNVWAGSCGFTLTMTGHQATMMRITILTGFLTVAGCLLVVRDYGSEGVASVASLGMILQNFLMLFFAKKRTGVWTHAQFLLTSER